MSEMELSEGSFNEMSHSSINEKAIINSDSQKRGNTINPPSKEMRMFASDSENEVIMNQKPGKANHQN